MRKLVTGSPEAGQRLDKYLGRYLSGAPQSFLYKMLRKKNITLNGKKASGSEKLQEGDEIVLFLSEDTIRNFGGAEAASAGTAASGNTGAASSGGPSGNAGAAAHGGSSGNGSPISGRNTGGSAKVPALPVLYENRDVIFFNKPAGMLSQKAKPEDYSVCEALTDRLLKTGELTQETLRVFRPGVCNRLDRNTSGVIAAGKTIRGLQGLSALLKERSLQKYYLCLVWGNPPEEGQVVSFLQKDEETNTVHISDTPPGEKVELRYRRLAEGRGAALLRVQLITGKSHQIRAQLAALGFPILGDSKYGDREKNRRFAETCPLRTQLLHAYELVFPGECPGLAELSGQRVLAPVPPHFRKCMIQLAIPEEAIKGRDE